MTLVPVIDSHVGLVRRLVEKPSQKRRGLPESGIVLPLPIGPYEIRLVVGGEVIELWQHYLGDVFSRNQKTKKKLLHGLLT
jgi:hypothetical protein